MLVSSLLGCVVYWAFSYAHAVRSSKFDQIRCDIKHVVDSPHIHHHERFPSFV
jgi:hypothetical protein